jgi:hypothetical protein
MDSCIDIIGEVVRYELNLDFVPAYFPNIQTTESHLPAPPVRLPGQYNQIVVVTPTLNLSREPIYPRLQAISIFPVILPATFGKKNFKFTYLDALRRRPPAGITTPAPGLTPKQQADYEKYDYKCQDKLNIPGTSPRKRSNDVFINGHRVSLGDSLFALLMRLAVELKKGKGGWVNTADLMAEGFINDIMLHQPYSNLRSKLEGSLNEKDGQKLIESSGSKEYRLSTHPDFVTYDREKLQSHLDKRLLILLNTHARW